VGSNFVLKALSGNGCAPSTATAAARWKASSVSGAPRSAASTAGSRHGTVATPPTATRASRIAPSCTSSATAVEHNANS
jgi:hypothetical protein